MDGARCFGIRLLVYEVNSGAKSIASRYEVVAESVQRNDVGARIKKRPEQRRPQIPIELKDLLANSSGQIQRLKKNMRAEHQGLKTKAYTGKYPPV